MYRPPVRPVVSRRRRPSFVRPSRRVTSSSSVRPSVRPVVCLILTYNTSSGQMSITNNSTIAKLLPRFSDYPNLRFCGFTDCEILSGPRRSVAGQDNYERDSSKLCFILLCIHTYDTGVISMLIIA